MRHAKGSWLVLLAMAFGCCDAGNLNTQPSSHGTVVLLPEVVADAANEEAVDALVATEVEVMGSDTIAREALSSLGMTEPFGADEGSALAGLRQAMFVERVGNSLVLRVTVSSADPTAAAEACNAVMRAYLDHRMFQRRGAAQQHSEWLSSQLTELREELERGPDPGARADLEAQYALLNERLAESELASALTTADAAILDRCAVPVP